VKKTILSLTLILIAFLFVTKKSNAQCPITISAAQVSLSYNIDSIQNTCTDSQTIFVSLDPAILDTNETTTYIWYWDDFSIDDTTFTPSNSHAYTSLQSFDLWVYIIDTCGNGVWYDVGDLDGIATITFPPNFSDPCNLSISAGFTQIRGTNFVTMDWGDGTLDTLYNNANPPAIVNIFGIAHVYVPGIYTATLVASGTRCSDTLQFTFTPGQTPTAAFSFSNPPPCVDDSIYFNDLSTTTALTTITSWSWDFGDTQSDTNQNPVHLYSPYGTYTVTLTVENQVGCSSTTTNNITISPDVNIASIGSSVSCPCNDIAFTSVGTATNWLWNFGDGTTSSSQNPVHTYSFPGQYNATLLATDVNGCTIEREIIIEACPNDVLFTSKSNNNWFFYERAGVDFSSGTPVANTAGQMTGPGGFPIQFVKEGTATISDPVTGNLLFYCSGTTIWDASHNIMLNGTGLFGDLSYSQASLILPYPGNPDRYYVFTHTEAPDTSLYYSIVNMTLNGGLGGVEPANKNVFLASAQGSEALSATIKLNPTCTTDAEYWLIIPIDTVRYGVYLINNAGISLSSSPSFTKPPSMSYTAFNIWGNSTFSPNGSKYIKSIIGQGFLSYDFNTNTGVLSNQVYYSESGSSNYDYNFSPNGRYLYSAGGNGIRQYDILALDIAGSITSLSNSSVGTMWVGDDGNIYAPRLGGGFLSRINNPNTAGASVTNNAISLGGRVGYYGMQNIVNLNVPFLDTLNGGFVADTSNCAFVSFTNNMITDTCSFNFINSNFYWDFGDGNTSTLYEPTNTYAASGTYNVQLVVERLFMCTSDTITQSVTTCSTVLPITLASFTGECKANNTVLLKWSTASEINNDYFTIERSSDAVTWNVISTVAGAGNSNALLNYQFEDDSPLNGTNYYRLKQTDFNGEFEYFDIVAVENCSNNTGEISIYPNPVINQLNITISSVNDANATVLIYDLLGNIVLEKPSSQLTKGNNKITINTEQLAKAMYMLVIEKEGQQYQLKFTK
jgi:PKD repeat protein